MSAPQTALAHGESRKAKPQKPKPISLAWDRKSPFYGDDPKVVVMRELAEELMLEVLKIRTIELSALTKRWGMSRIENRDLYTLLMNLANLRGKQGRSYDLKRFLIGHVGRFRGSIYAQNEDLRRSSEVEIVGTLYRTVEVAGVELQVAVHVATGDLDDRKMSKRKVDFHPIGVRGAAEPLLRWFVESRSPERRIAEKARQQMEMWAQAKEKKHNVKLTRIRIPISRGSSEASNRRSRGDWLDNEGLASLWYEPEQRAPSFERRVEDYWKRAWGDED